MLVLFDLDLTLVSTGGAGRGAMEAAGRALFGPGFARRGVEFAGRLDPVILADLLAANGLEPTPARADAFRRAYRDELEAALRERADRCRVLPGVPELLDAVEREGWTLGLLTGNFEETGRLKLRACGLDADRFPVRVWGDASREEPHERHKLVAAALERWRRGPAEAAVVIGDTPHDVAGALHHGARPIGVCTGGHDRFALESAGAALVVDDLSDTEALIAWMRRPAAAAGASGASAPAR